jgi:hypothetical protein
MRYENWLRQTETRIGSIVGVDGGIDAMRRALYRPMNADQLPDFVAPLTVVEHGGRVVFEPLALLREEALAETGSEYRMRVRVTLRALWALRDRAGLLNPLRRPLYAWQLWSHKLLRYLSVVPLTVAAVANLVLAVDSHLYQWILAGQLLFWVSVLAGVVWPKSSTPPAPARYCYYFALLNAASATALVRFAAGKKQVLWTPRVG